MDMIAQGLTLSIHHHPQPNLAAETTHCPQNRRTVIGEGSTSTSFVSPSARRVGGVEVLNALFPPHSETSRRFQSQGQAKGSPVGAVGHYREPDVAISAPSCRSILTRALIAHSTGLAQTRAAAEPPVRALAGSLRIAFYCRDD